MKIVFTYAHVKCFYGQSERAYSLNYFIIVINRNGFFFSSIISGSCKLQDSMLYFPVTYEVI